MILRSYRELVMEAEAYFEDHYDELLVIGPPGIGKSETFRQLALQHLERCHYLEGNTKPLATYMECYRHRHKLLVFDDAEGLWASENGKHLLRQLTQHCRNKYVQWLSTVRDLDRQKIPTSFHTTSKCAFLMNRFVTNDQFSEAILDRGHVFYFDPPAPERHKYVATWFHDQQIHDFIGSHLHLASDITARTYNLLDQKKHAGHDWKQYFFDRFCHDSVLLAVQQLENDKSYRTVEDRINEFARRGLGCRRTYYNYKNELSSSGQLTIAPSKPIPVQGEPPEPFNRDELLRRRAEKMEEADEEVIDEKPRLEIVG